MNIGTRFQKMFDDDKNQVMSMYLKIVCNELGLGREHFLGRHTLNECKSIADDIKADELYIRKAGSEYFRDIVSVVIYLDSDQYKNNCYERWDNVGSTLNEYYGKFRFK